MTQCILPIYFSFRIKGATPLERQEGESMQAKECRQSCQRQAQMRLEAQLAEAQDRVVTTIQLVQHQNETPLDPGVLPDPPAVFCPNR